VGKKLNGLFDMANRMLMEAGYSNPNPTVNEIRWAALYLLRELFPEDHYQMMERARLDQMREQRAPFIQT
jgi:hypothetical protein